MKAGIIFTILLCFFYLPVVFSSASEETLVFLRHGEKYRDHAGQLNCQGFNRSLKLPARLITLFSKPDYIFAPNPNMKMRGFSYTRPLATILPTAIKYNFPINTDYGYHETQALAKELLSNKYQSSLIFLAWSHGGIVKIVRQLCDMSVNKCDSKKVPEWTTNDYDSLYILKLKRLPAHGIQATFDSSKKEGLNELRPECAF